MKFTYNWLKDFVEIKIPPKELADKLTMAGIEVGSIEEKQGDFVFEIEITSNRPDWLSVIGIAREVAAITSSQFTVHSSQLKCKNSQRENLKIEIQDKQDCPLYTARIIRGVKVGSSPEWLKQRLELIGCRSVNNVVDITNYILFTYGEPLHAFDLDKLNAGSVIVRRAKSGEKITTIDGQNRELGPGVLVIADAQKPVAIAGIMGGKDTEVTATTQNILLEAAIFNPVVVRRGKRAQGLESDSAYRFERGIDLETAESASLAAADLINKLCLGQCVTHKCVGKTQPVKKEVILDNASVEKILGARVPLAKVKQILSALGFGLKNKGKNKFLVTVPLYRQDVAAEIDLIEEIARVFGYKKIPATLPKVQPQLSAVTARDLAAISKNILVGSGLNEVITYSLISRDLLKGFSEWGRLGALEILNPLSKEQEILRPTLIPSIAACVAYNLNQGQDYINIFEVANAFSPPENLSQEELKLAIALCGSKFTLLEQGLIKEASGILPLKGIVETFFQRMGIKDYQFGPQRGLEFSISIAGKSIGRMGRLGKYMLDTLGIKNREVFCAELSLKEVFECAKLKKELIPLPKYPAITRDISFSVKEGVAAGEILSKLKEAGKPLLETVTIVDYYRGKQIPEGSRALTLSCVYRADNRTLTESEVTPLHNLLCELLTREFAAQMR